jgi:hypothetical protein
MLLPLELELAGDIKTWLRLGLILEKFENLERLWIWLDHDEDIDGF